MKTPLLRSRILTAALLVVCAWLAYQSVHVTLRRLEAARQLDILENQIVEHQRGNERIVGQLERMQQPAWLTLLARQQLNYQAPGETVVFVYKNEEAGIISQPRATPRDTRPNWKKWWDWLLKRESETEAGIVQW